MRMKTEKELIESYLRKVSILTRIYAEDNEATHDEAVQMMVDIANREINEVMQMTDKEFVMFCLIEMANDVMEYRKEIDNEINN